MHNDDFRLPILVALIVLGLVLMPHLENMARIDVLILSIFSIVVAVIACLAAFRSRSSWGRKRLEKLQAIVDLPEELRHSDTTAIQLGFETTLQIPIYLPDKIRTRHVHVIGATGSGKTESVILNFLKQDMGRGFGAIILDAKGDDSFLRDLQRNVPQHQLAVFDLGSALSDKYDPLAAGTPLEAAQRIFSSLVWSEEYYKSKALSALQRMFEKHFAMSKSNPTLVDLNSYLSSPSAYIAFLMAPDFPKALAMKEYEEVTGLRDQIRSLTLSHLANTLSPSPQESIQLEDARNGKVIYFRLQSLMSPQLVGSVGKLIINHLNFIAGSVHREESTTTRAKLIPVYLDEFATFACPEFADLISKARSAGFALHFSHQSIGDLMEVSEGFLSRITDNSATKIVMRINDPDSADYFARAFGTHVYQKATQRVTNAKQLEKAEVLEEGTIREAHQFRASPDQMKTLPTGHAVVLIAHGNNSNAGGSSVHQIEFLRDQDSL